MTKNKNPNKNSRQPARPQLQPTTAAVHPTPQPTPATVVPLGQPPAVVLQPSGPPLSNSPPTPDLAKGKWHESVGTWVAVFALLLNIVALVFTSQQNNINSRDLQEQIRLQRESVEQSRPVDFQVESTPLTNGDLQLRIRNFGKAEIAVVNAQFKYYFAFPDGQTKSRLDVQAMLRDTPKMLDAVKASHLIIKPNDVERLLGKARLFHIRSLKGSEGPADAEFFEPELSQSSILNAVRLASALDAKAVMRWRFEYQHAVSRQRFTSFLYILLVPNTAPTVLQVRVKEVLDLNKTIGGVALIEAITQFEDTSSEVIFPSPESAIQ
jgi:hypothetical protein